MPKGTTVPPFSMIRMRYRVGTSWGKYASMEATIFLYATLWKCKSENFHSKNFVQPFFPRVHFPSPLDISRYWLENRFSSHSLTVSLFFEKTITQCYLPIPCSPIRLITSNFSTHNAVLFFNILFDNYPPKNPTCLNRTE